MDQAEALDQIAHELACARRAPSPSGQTYVAVPVDIAEPMVKSLYEIADTLRSSHDAPRSNPHQPET